MAIKCILKFRNPLLKVSFTKIVVADGAAIIENNLSYRPEYLTGIKRAKYSLCVLDCGIEAAWWAITEKTDALALGVS